MTKINFYVRALWDEEAKVFYCESDIVGLHIEAKTLDEFEATMREIAPKLLVANHIPVEDFKTKPISDLIPSWMWQRPDKYQLSHA